MVILEVTVPTFGRFFVHDDLSIEEILLLPSTGEDEVRVLQETMQRKDSPWALKSEVLLASLSTVFNVSAEFVTFHRNKEPDPDTEPEQ